MVKQVIQEDSSLNCATQHEGSFLSFLLAHPYRSYALLLLMVIFLTAQMDRFLLGVARLDFIDYNGSQYGLLSGPLFIVVFTLTGTTHFHLSLFSLPTSK